MTPNIYKGSKTDFSYLVGMSLQRRMPWGTLASLLKDLAPTLEETREVISILLKELEFLQSSLQKKEKEVEICQKQRLEDDILDQNNFLEAVYEENQQESSVSESETNEDEIEVLEDVKERMNEESSKLHIGQKYPNVAESNNLLSENEENDSGNDFMGHSEREIDNEWYTFVSNDKAEMQVEAKETELKW